MFEFVSCLEQHDPRELVWAVMICLMSVAAGVSAYRRARLTDGRFRFAWLALMAFLLGGGVWATHFMAMLAFRKHTPSIFGFQLTLVSLLVAYGGVFVGAWIAARTSRALGQALGGAICGLTIAAMHFIGVSAMRFPARLSWDPVMVAAAVIIGVSAAAAAFAVAGDLKSRRAAFGGAGLLVLAICGLHFTAMAAVTLTPAAMIVAPGFYSGEGLALGVGALAGVVLICGAGVILMDGMSKAATLSALRTALNQVPCAIGFFDRDQKLIFWNDNFTVLLAAYRIEARAALSYETLATATERNGMPSQLREMGALSGGKLDDPISSQFRTPDGRWFEARSGATRDGGFVALLTDVTAQRELIEQQAQAQALAEQVSRAKSEFLANTSHEIRTPLNALLGMVQVMERNDLDPAQRHRLQVVAESGRSLLAVLNSVLDLAKIEAGRFELDEQPFDLVQTVQQAVGGFEPLAAQKEISLSVEIEAAAVGVWRGDSERLRQVLSNLVSNAIKFTPQGHVAVQVACAEGGLRFAVEDTGVGIAPEKHDLIFGAFTQADASTTREFGGAGLGLTICSGIVRSMGGRLTLRSELNAGAEFVFLLPLQRLEDAARPPAAPAADTAHLPLKILVAEDNATNQLVLSALLEPFGVVLTLTEDGRAAVEAFAHGGFDAVLMDVQMPRMNGIQAAAEIRRIESELGLNRIPIVALTANVMSHQVQEYLTAGMDGFIAKPIQLSELLDALATLPAQLARAAA